MSDFLSLPHAEQLRLLDQLACIAAQRFGVEAERRKLLQYERNAVYHLTAGCGPGHVLRVSAESGYSPREQASELAWLSWLHAQAHRVPEPVAAADGQLVLELGAPGARPRTCVVFRWLEGEPPTAGISERQIAELGCATAALHAHPAHFATPPGFTRPSLGWSTAFGVTDEPAGVIDEPAGVINEPAGVIDEPAGVIDEPAGVIDEPAGVIDEPAGVIDEPAGVIDEPADVPSGHRALLERVGRRLKPELDELASEPACWLHGDLHRDNVLVHGTAVGFIDFEDCGWGHPLLDVASLLDSFRRRVVPRADYVHARAAFLEAYRPAVGSGRELTRQLAVFKALRDAITLRFLTSSKNESVQSWANDRITQLVRHLHGYLDGDPPRV